MIPRPSLRTILIAAAVVILAIALLFHLWQRSRTEATRAKLGESQAEASVESGRDALDTYDNATDREAAIDATTQENDRDIRNAEGAGTDVGEPVRNAGMAALCRRAAYRNDPRCQP